MGTATQAITRDELSSVTSFMSSYPAAELLKELIEIDTQNPPGNERTIIDRISGFFTSLKESNPQHPVEMTVLDNGAGRASLIVKVAGMDADGIAFCGHVDTVRVGDESLWHHPPFKGELIDGLMYGRGAADMKCGDTAMLMTAAYLIGLDVAAVPRDVYFIFTADEEIGSVGIISVRESEAWKNFSEVIVCEPTSNKPAVFEKGAALYTVSVIGRTAHAAAPADGINAIEAMTEFYHRLKSDFHSESASDFGDRMSVSITTINGGTNRKVIPDKASATIDVRTVAEGELELLESAMKSASEQVELETGASIAIEREFAKRPLTADQSSSLFSGLRESFALLDIPFEITCIRYYTDMEELYGLCPFRFVVLGPGHEEDMHQIDEKASIAEVRDAASIYALYALETRR